MAPKAETPSVAGKAPAGKAPAGKAPGKEAGKKSAAAAGVKKRSKTRKESYSTYIYKGK